MKKQLLTLGLLAMVTLSFGQFTFTSTSISFTGNGIPAATDKGQFYSFQPNNNGGTMFANNNCTTPITQGALDTEVGGFDPTIHNTADGIAFYGGRIRTVFYGSPCAANSPSLGFTTGTSTGLASGTDIDLSATANQKVQFTYISDADITFSLGLFDAAYNNKLTSGTTVTLIGDGDPHTITVDFSGSIAPSAVLTDVRQVSFIYTSSTLSPSFGIIMTDIAVGSTVTTGINAAQNLISESNLFPNPATESATVRLNLVSNSNVKVVLNDLVGKQMKVVAEGNFTNLEQSFSVADLAKGMYTVTYFINGAAAKTQSLVVR